MTSDNSSSSPDSPEEPFVLVDPSECGPEIATQAESGSSDDRVNNQSVEIDVPTTDNQRPEGEAAQRDYVGEELSPLTPPPGPVFTPELSRKWLQLSEINSNDDLDE